MTAQTNQTHAEKVLDERCTNCGGRLKQFPVRDDGVLIGQDVGCPNFFREQHCPEVVREVRE